MAEPTDRPQESGAGENGDDPLRQPAQEIVDPRDEDPNPDGPVVEISGTREPGDA